MNLAAVSAMFPGPMRLRLTLLALLALACSHITGEVKFGQSAEDDFKAGEERLAKHQYPEATRLFEHVRNKYPFSRYAALSELRLADTKFDSERFVEAAEAYKTFVRLHPTHEQADYAAYRAGLAYWKDGPSDFFILPPAYERDEASVKETVKTLQDFASKYPKSKYGPEAAALLAKARARLVDHEWYAVDFYTKRKRWAGAAMRLEGLVKNYPDSPREPEALLALANAYVNLDERYRAQQALQQLIVKHPQDPRRAEAEKLLASLR